MERIGMKLLPKRLKCSVTLHYNEKLISNRFMGWDGINLFWMKKVMWSKMQLRVALRIVNLVNPPAMTS